MVATLSYFVDPFDIIPDFIPVQGYDDDATMMEFCLDCVRKELLRYIKSRKLKRKDYGL